MHKIVIVLVLVVLGCFVGKAQEPSRIGSNTQMLQDGDCYAVDQYMYYIPGGTKEVWRTDATDAGTVKVFDYSLLNPTVNHEPVGFVKMNGNIFFMLSINTDTVGLFKFDHVNTTPVLIRYFKTVHFAEAVNYNYFKGMIAYKNKLYFGAADYYTGSVVNNKGIELWCSDGTSTGTTMLRDILPGSLGFYTSSNPMYFVTIGNTLFFSALKQTGSGQNYHYVLYETDGTEINTVPYNFGSVVISSTSQNGIGDGAFIYKFLNGNCYIAFKSFLNTDQTNIYKIIPGQTPESNSFLRMSDFSWLNNKIVFGGIPYSNGISDTTGAELYTIDEDLNTLSITLIKNINVSSSQASSFPFGMEAIGGKLYFQGIEDATYTHQLYTTDLTTSGTVKVTNFTPEFENFTDYIRYNNQLYFNIKDSTIGNEPYRYNPATGLVEKWDIFPGQSAGVLNNGLMSANGNKFFTAGGVLYFEGYNNPLGFGIWKYGSSATGLVNQENQMRLNWYPNPANEYIQLSDNSACNTVMATDMQGRKYKLIKDKDEKFYLNKISKGIYFLQAIEGEKVIGLGKLIKE